MRLLSVSARMAAFGFHTNRRGFRTIWSMCLGIFHPAHTLRSARLVSLIHAKVPEAVG